MQIFKYQIPIVSQEKFSINLPVGSEVLSFQSQHNDAFIWACVDENKKTEPRWFSLYGTGQPIDVSQKLGFIGTIQLNGLVLHLFERC